VRDASNGRDVGLWYFDPFARAGKRSGAWMSVYREQGRVDGDVKTIVSNNANFVAPSAGEPALISWDDANTLFHEFGHALHGLCSDVTYPSLAGTSVARDFVEFPSQILEDWLSDPAVLDRFARHHETGEVIPQELVARIARAAAFNQGFETTEYLSSALYDMRVHLAADAVGDPDAFVRRLLEDLGMPPEVDMRHRPPHFLHVFASDGYSAGYYSYLWADVLTADALDAFREGEGLFDRAVAARLHRHVLSAGNTREPADAYRRFRGRDASVAALMRKRGL
jgi:peptidyl-dipeptidase Dcp